jgi:hypothetical protein
MKKLTLLTFAALLICCAVFRPALAQYTKDSCGMCPDPNFTGPIDPSCQSCHISCRADFGTCVNCGVPFQCDQIMPLIAKLSPEMSRIGIHLKSRIGEHYVFVKLAGMQAAGSALPHPIPDLIHGSAWDQWQAKHLSANGSCKPKITK